MIGKLVSLAILLALLVAGIVFLTAEPEQHAHVEDIIAADKAFARLALKKGTLAAFYQYMADDGKVLPQQSAPIDRNYYGDLISKMSGAGTGSVLKWQPQEARIAKSGELGYTFGTYQQIQQTENLADTSFGFYITIWQKQNDGQWKFIWDAGNTLKKE